MNASKEFGLWLRDGLTFGPLRRFLRYAFCALRDHGGLTPIEYDDNADVWRCKRCGGEVNLDEW